MALEDLLVKISADDSSLTKKLNSANEKFEKFAKKLGRAGRDISEVFTLPITALSAAAFRFSEEASAAFVKFASSVKLSLGRLGTSISRAINLEGILEKIAKKVEDLVNWFDSLSDTQKKWTVGVAFAVAAAGPLLIMLGKLGEALSSIIEIALIGLPKLATLAAFAWKALAALATAIGVAGFATIAAGALILGWAEVLRRGADKSDELTNKLKELGGAYETLGKKIEEARSAENRQRMRGGMTDKHTEKAQEEVKQKRVKLELEGLDTLPSPLMTDDIKQKYRVSLLDQRKTPDRKPTALEQENRNKQLKKELDLVSNLSTQLQDMNASWVLNQGSFNRVNAEFDILNSNYLEMSRTLDSNDVRLVAMRERMAELLGVGEQLRGMMTDLPILSVEIAGSIYNIYQELIAGVSQAIANAIVYAQNLSSALKGILKSIAASIIQMLIKVGIERIAAAIISSSAAAKEASANIGGTVGWIGVLAYAAAVETLGLAGLVVGAGIALGAMAAATGLAATGIAQGSAVGNTVGKYSEGGIALSPQVATLAEKGKPEMILNQDNVDKFLGNRGMTVQVFLDGKTLIDYHLRKAPDRLRLYGAVT